MKIVFFGASKFVLPILEVLRKNFDVALVLTTEKLPVASQGLALRGYGVIGYCVKYGIPFSVSDLSNPTIRHTLSAIRSPLGILAYFGLILPKEILNLFPKGILNIHPSLLPKYRGPTPGQSAILHNDSATGVSLIKLDEEVDHGPIIDQVEERLTADDTAETLYQRLFEIGAKLLDKNIQKYIKGQTKLSEQAHARATFTKHLTRQSGYIDFSNPPSFEKLDRMIRAFYPWPSVWGKWKMTNDKWKILKFLPQQKIQVEGKKPMSYKDFINGYPEGKSVLQKLH